MTRAVRARYLFERREVRGVYAPLASATKDGVTLREDSENAVWNPGDDVSLYKLVEPDDFVIGLRSFQHGIARSSVRGLVSPAYTVLRARTEDLLPDYFTHYFRSAALVAALDNMSQGIRQGRTIPYEPFSNLQLPLPPMEEQRRIADFLDDQVARLDGAMELRRRQSSALAARTLAVMRLATTVGSACGRETRSSGIAWMPAINSAWDLRRLASVFMTGSGTTPPASDSRYFAGGIPWVNTGDLRDRLIDRPKRTVTSHALADYPTLRLYDPGTLLIAMYGATIGRLGILGIRACTNQACCALTGESSVLTDFAYYWFLSHRDGIIEMAAGAGQPNISQEVIRGLHLPTPSRKEQEEIVRDLRRTEAASAAAVALMERHTGLLQERKQALITAAVTGQFDVTAARAVA